MALKEYKPGTSSPAAWARTIGESEPGLAGAAAGERRRAQCLVHRARRHRLWRASSAERHRVARSLAIGERQILRHGDRMHG